MAVCFDESFAASVEVETLADSIHLLQYSPVAQMDVVVIHPPTVGVEDSSGGYVKQT